MIRNLLRKNIRDLEAYSSARKEYEGVPVIQMDANESPFNTGFNRYPDPMAHRLKEKIASLKDINPENIFLGNGSDEAIDLLMRAFCEPGKDFILQFTPTYGMYEVSAAINDIGVISLALSDNFSIDTGACIKAIKEINPKIIFICSPNNPTGNLIDAKAIEMIIEACSKSIVVLDEAYIDFAYDASFLPRLEEFDRLVVLQTFSKALGMAGVRLGMAYAHREIIDILNRIKPPYNLSLLTQNKACEALVNMEKIRSQVKEILHSRGFLQKELSRLPVVKKVYPSEANFLLVEFFQAKAVKKYLDNKGIIVRNRSAQIHNCLRISIGTKDENQALINALNEFPL